MSCCGGASGVVIRGGEGIGVLGSGTVGDPYVIYGDVNLVLKAIETETVQVNISGTGNTSDPYVISATAKIGVGDLEDVLSPQPANSGDVLLFDGEKWTFGPPPTQEPGQVNTGAGLSGDGTLATPLRVRVSEAVETSTGGLATYVDSNGELRAVRPTSGTTWGAISGKPSTFSPSSHTHSNSDLTGMLTGTGTPSASAGVNGAIYIQHT